eukprot:GGOE01017762.1.p1 GENE.GGOE01017762.1~~GGOE01017762.1.p1  ORF type:complete len:585 (+),score=152.84 GGOE01017762.1:120-1874(+)
MARSTGLIRLVGLSLGLLLALLLGTQYMSGEIATANLELARVMAEEHQPLEPATLPPLSASPADDSDDGWVLALNGTSPCLTDWLTNTLDREDLDTVEQLFSVPVHQPRAVWPGYTVFAFSFNSYLLVYNMEGRLVGARRTASRREHVVYHGVKFVNSSTLLALRVTLAQPHNHNVVKTTHFMLWNLQTGAELLVRDPLPPNKYATFHHDIDYNPASRTFLGLYKYLHRNSSAFDDRAVYDAFYEVNEAGGIVWEWDARREFPWDQHQREHWIHTGDCAQVWQLQKRDCIDWMHGNTLYWDFEDDMIYYNSRSLDSFFKINRRSKKTLWGIGRMGTVKLFDKEGKPSPSLFYHAHSVDKNSDRRFMIFDNNYNNRHTVHGGPRLANLHFQSGMTEVELSPDEREARITWSWFAPRNYSSVYNGDADSLPNGNVLGTFPQGISLVEVSRAGEVVWELRGPPDKVAPYRWPIYRSERVYHRPLLLHPRRLTVRPGMQSVLLQLKVWNTHKSRLHTPAVLAIGHFPSGFALQKNFLLRKYWQVTLVNISIPLVRLHPAGCTQPSHLMVTITNSDGVNVEAEVSLLCQ